MKNLTTAQIVNKLALLAAISVSLGILIAKIPASELRNHLLVLGGVLWFLFVVTYPVAVLHLGAVPGTQGTVGSYRASSPASFWVGLIATTTLWAGVVAFIYLYSYMAWYSGA